ncbi:MAG TPA: YfbM family protein [Terriglobia bacterium]|nr:YfbM family protein [Terriglobia bacterium]
MPNRGVHFALTRQDLDGILATESDEELLSVLSDGIEERWDEEWLAQTDKAWDAIHRCLTDGELAYENGSYPLRLCILGGQQLYSGDDYIVSLKKPEECVAIAQALARINIDWMREQYFAIPSNDFGREPTEADFQYTWGWFTGLDSFYGRAARANRHVIFTVDL